MPSLGRVPTTPRDAGAAESNPTAEPAEAIDEDHCRRPLGMFDSGFGGLTVARAVMDLAPQEDLVYLGDTGRYPYGPRSLEDVRCFSRQIAEYLVDQHEIKLLVVACNTATAAALPSLRSELEIPVVGVVNPGVRAVVAASQSGHLGVIGTIGTIDSGVYERSLAAVAPEATVTTCACPGFVEFVERGVTDGREVEILARRLLAPVIDADVDALLLGCTHYPYLARVLADVVGRRVVLVSSADETAFAVTDLLADLGLGHPDRYRLGKRQFISSGDVRAFAELGGRLLGPELGDALLWSPPSD